MNFPFVSTILGIVEFLIQQVIGLLTSLLNAVIDIVIAMLAKFLYNIAVAFFQIADFAQMFFRRLAGMDVHWYEGVQTTGDPLMTLISNENVLEVMVALGIVAFTMLMIATVVQIIRIQYTTEGAKNTVGNIIGQSLKALAMFLIVPVASFIGIFISNQLLMAVDGATNQSGSTYISGAIFVASASEANRVRSSEGDNILTNIFSYAVFPYPPITVDRQGNIKETGATNNGATDEAYRFVHSGDATENRQVIAEKIDYAFANKLQNNNTDATYNNFLIGDHFDYNNIIMVNAYYKLGEINYIILFTAAGLAIWALYNAAFGLIMRLYKGAFLFIISPPVVAIMPLDGGNGFKQWRTAFLGAVIGAYGVVVSLNLFFLLLPILKKIQLFDPNATLFGIDTGNATANSALATNYYYNNFVYLLFVVVGCFMFKNLSKLVSGIFGGEDVLDTGSEMSGKAVGMATKIAMGVATGGASLAGGIASGASAVSNKNQSKAFMKSAQEKLDNKDYVGARADFNKAQAFEKKAKISAERFENNQLTQLGKRGINAVTGGIGLGPDVVGRTKKSINTTKSYLNDYTPLKSKEKWKFDEGALIAGEEEMKANELGQKPGYVNGMIAAKQSDPYLEQYATERVEDYRSNVGSTIDRFDAANTDTERQNAVGDIKKALEDMMDNERANDLLEKINTNLTKMADLQNKVTAATAGGNTAEAKLYQDEYDKLKLDFPKLTSGLRSDVDNHAGEMANFIANPTTNVSIDVMNDTTKVLDSMGGNSKQIIDDQIKKSISSELSKIKQDVKDKAAKKSELDELAKAISGAMKPALNEISKGVKDAAAAAKKAEGAAKKAGKK